MKSKTRSIPYVLPYVLPAYFIDTEDNRIINVSDCVEEYETDRYVSYRVNGAKVFVKRKADIL